MRITQGAFSFLPDLTDDQIRAQIQYCLDNNWAVSVEYTDDPHPRNVYWNMWKLPLFDLKDAEGVMQELDACRKEFPNYYVRINGFDSTYGRQTTAISFIVQRPKEEPGFRLERQEVGDRAIRYTTHAYAVDKPAGSRYE